MKRKIISMVIGIIITNMICIFPVLAAGNNYNLLNFPTSIIHVES